MATRQITYSEWMAASKAFTSQSALVWMDK